MASVSSAPAPDDAVAVAPSTLFGFAVCSSSPLSQLAMHTTSNALQHLPGLCLDCVCLEWNLFQSDANCAWQQRP